jgi:hypothetical protein
MPLAVIDLDLAQAGAPYREKLVLSRPDQHIAWRGDAMPDPAALIARVTGTR